jgi:hypothetical protein
MALCGHEETTRAFNSMQGSQVYLSSLREYTTHACTLGTMVQCLLSVPVRGEVRHSKEKEKWYKKDP